MELSPELLQRMADAVATGQPVTADVYVDLKDQTMTLSRDYEGWWNAKITRAGDTLNGAQNPVTHYRFHPMLTDGCVVMLPAVRGESGATPFVRSDSGRTGTINMRQALIGFNLTFPRSGKLHLPVEVVDLPGAAPRKALALFVKNPNSQPQTTAGRARPARKRKAARKPAASAAPEAPAAPAAPAASVD